MTVIGQVLCDIVKTLWRHRIFGGRSRRTYLWSTNEEKNLVADTDLGYFKELFNAGRAHFNSVGRRLVGTGKARKFFVDQGLDNSDTLRWWFRLQLNMRSITERMVRVSSTYCVRDFNLRKLLRFIFRNTLILPYSRSSTGFIFYNQPVFRNLCHCDCSAEREQSFCDLSFVTHTDFTVLLL
jgi:hypothetical protein